MPHVILINVHGGYPTAMVKRSFCELPGFVRLLKMSHTNDRVYPTNVCAGPSLYDMLMDAPLGTMTDSVWHSWAFVKHATRSIFHVFKQHGYQTRLFGCFGLDSRLDPSTHMHTDANGLRESLSMYGIDECDSQDSSFTCQVGFAHDNDALHQVVDFLERHKNTPKIMTVVNLLGCQDAHRCLFSNMDPAQRTDMREYDERHFSENVLNDPRNEECHAQIEALRRAALTNDWICGTKERPTREETIRSVTGMHDFCWKCLTRISEGVENILDVLEKHGRLNDATIYLFSDHPMSLYEHGQICETPWEACLRSFLVRKTPSRTSASSCSAPLSLGQLPNLLFTDVGITVQPPWRTLSDGNVTLGLACSWLGRASVAPAMTPSELRTFFIRAVIDYNYRPYAFTFWFSLSDLVATRMSNEWENPVLKFNLEKFADQMALQVFEHVSDAHELQNLALDAAWIRGEVAVELKAQIDQTLRDMGLQHIRLKIPPYANTVSIEHVNLCSVQLHHRVCRRLAQPVSNRLSAVTKISISTQTETPTFLVALQDTFGRDIGRLINSQLGESTPDQPLTIFAPQSGIENDKWLTWAPPPLRGAYTQDVMKRVASHGISVTDALRGDMHVVQPIDDENVFFKSCRILLRSAVRIFHSRGFAIGYRVCPTSEEEEIEESTSNSSRTNSNPASVNSGTSTKTRSAHTMSRIQRDRNSRIRAPPTNVSIRKMESQLLRQHM